MKWQEPPKSLAWLKRWLKRYWYPLVVLTIELMQFIRLFHADTTAIQWAMWAAVLIPALLSIRFRHMGLLIACGVYAVLVASPASVSFSSDFIWFAVGYLCATSPAFLGISAGVLVGIASTWGVLLAAESFFTALYVLILDMVPIAIGLSIASYRRLYEAERENRRLQLMAQSQVFATKVHDSVSHALVQISILSSPHTGEAKFTGDKQLHRIHELSARGLREMRDLVQELQLQSQHLSESPTEPKISADNSWNATPAPKSGADLDNALQEFADALQRSGFTFDLQIRGNLKEISDTKALVLRECLREMSTNVLKYADSSRPVILLLRVVSGTLHLYSANQISPKDSNFPSTKQGLVGIRHRIQALGGTVTTNKDDTNWYIAVTI